MRRLSKKEALVYREYKRNMEAALCSLLGKPVRTEKIEYADIAISAKEAGLILKDLISEGFLYKDMTVLSILEKDGSLIRLVDEPTEEEQLAALGNHIPNTYKNIPNLTDKAKRLILKLRGGDWGEYEWIQDLPDEELKLLMDENPDIAMLLPEERWTQYLVTEYLRKMVTDKRRELIDDYQHRVRIPGELRDKTFYRAYCMVAGYNYSKIPKERREEIINEKLIRYTLDNTTSYTSALWMYEYLPEHFKTEEVSLRCCVLHFGCFSYLPEELKTYDFISKCIQMGQNSIPSSLYSLLSEDEIIDLIGRAGGYTCPEIDKKVITKKIAFALAQFICAPNVIPKQFRTREWYLAYVGRTGHLDAVPEEFVDEEMCISAIRGNYLAARKSVPEKCETQHFLEVEAAEIHFRDLSDIKISHTAEILNKFAYEKPYNLKEIPEEEKYLVTDETLVRIIHDKERFWDNVLNFRENDAIVNALIEMTDPNTNGEIKNRFYVMSQLSKVPEFIIEEFLSKEPRTITMKGITKEQMERSVDYFPDNVLYLPDDIAEEGSECEDAEKPKETEGEKQDPFAAITAETKYEQMSIWDILTA